MTIKTFIDKLNLIKDHDSSVYFYYGSEYPAVKVIVRTDPFRKNEVCVVIMNNAKYERDQILTIQDLKNKLRSIKSISEDAFIYIEAYGYKGLPEEFNLIKEYKFSNNFKKIIISNSKDENNDPEYAMYLRLKKKFES